MILCVWERLHSFFVCLLLKGLEYFDTILVDTQDTICIVCVTGSQHKIQLAKLLMKCIYINFISSPHSTLHECRAQHLAFHVTEQGPAFSMVNVTRNFFLRPI